MSIKNSFALTIMVVALLSGCANGEKISKVRPVASKDAATRAFNLRMAGQLDDAKDLLQNSVKMEPGNEHTHFELARLSFYMVDLETARSAINRAVNFDPDNARYPYWAGIIAAYSGVGRHHGFFSMFRLPGDFKRAKKSLERAVELDPEHHEARLILIQIYKGLPWLLGGSSSKARKHVEKMEALDRVYGAKGRSALLGSREHEKRRELWEEVVGDVPDSAKAHYELGAEYISTGDFDKSIEHLEKALELDPEVPKPLIMLARCYQKANKRPMVVQTYRKYLDFVPAPPLPNRINVMKWLASAEKRLGNNREGDRLLEKAKELDPLHGKPKVKPVYDMFTAP
ncbi:tetratricopeptide repeat protein [Candidatus Hydrogenedentota bacterium]